jgi:hypothetical protein
MAPAPAVVEEAKNPLAPAKGEGVGRADQRPPSSSSLSTSAPACGHPPLPSSASRRWLSYLLSQMAGAARRPRSCARPGGDTKRTRAAVEFSPEMMLSLGFCACGGGGRGIGAGRGWWSAGGPVHCRNCAGGHAR